MKKTKHKNHLTPTLSPSGEGGSKPDRSPIGRPDEFRLIARAELHPDPDQPRKTFDAASLQELADSIAEQGIVQPLIVRAVTATYKIEEPDLTSKDYRLLRQNQPTAPWQHLDRCDEKNIKALRDSWAGNFGGLGTPADYADRFVIVAGERRWRAAELAGLAELPCIVRDLDAHRVFAQQFIENEQRVNISAMEEAEALTKNLTSRQAENLKFSVEDLAKELGMSRAGLYQRLALTRLHPPVRAALLAGTISTSVASVVAIVPLPAQQEKLLKHITNEKDWQFPFSVRDVQELVDEDYCKQLSSAPFDLDKTFDDAPVVVGCKVCPQRSGYLVDQFPELAKKPNVCTRPDCFAAKCKAHWLAKSQDLAQRGATVLTEKEFKSQKFKLVAADKQCYGIFAEYGGTPEGILKKHAPEPVYVSTATGLERFFAVQDIAAAAKAAKVKLVQGSQPKTETPEAKSKREANELAEKLRGERREAFVLAFAPTMVKALQKLNMDKSWQFARLMMEGVSGFYDHRVESLFPYHKEKDARLGMLFRLACDEESFPVDHEGFKKGVVEAWKLAGIDLVKAFDAEERTAQPALALPGKKAAQAELLGVKKHKPKR